MSSLTYMVLLQGSLYDMMTDVIKPADLDSRKEDQDLSIEIINVSRL